MAVRIRLRRIGSKKKPFYRIFAIDSRKAQNSTPLEQIGHYNPLDEDIKASINMDRLNYWLKCGAKPSERVASILKRIKETQAIPPKQ